MKNHVAFKFAAVILAALLLLTAVSSGCGILLLSKYDLYNRTAEEGYEETMRDIREEFAQALVFRYASMELGGCSTPLIDDYYGNGALYTSFRWGRYAYTVRDQEGNTPVVLDRELPNAEHYVIPVENGRFIYLLAEKNVEQTTADRLKQPETTEPSETEPSAEPSETTVPMVATTVATVPEETTENTVSQVTEATEAVETAETKEKTSEETEASVVQESEAAPTEEPAGAAAETSAEGTGEPAGEKAAEAPTGESTEAPTEAATQPPTEAATEPSTEAPTEPPETTEPAVPEEEDRAASLKYEKNSYYTRDQFDEAFSYPYYNYETGSMLDATLCYASTSDFTVDLYLAPDALYDYQMWDLLRVIGPMRGQLFLILGCSLLAFAGLMAYLFCAAGRKPGSEKIEPMGFNRMPLDLYTLLLGLGFAGCAWVASLGIQVFQNTQILQMAVAAGACFLGCLLLICFSLAWASQLKVEKYFWMRNTLTARILHYVLIGLQWLGKRLWVYMKRLPDGFRWLSGKCKKWIHGILILMPVMWQWLACTGGVLFLLLLAFILKSWLLILLSFLLAVVLVIYGAYCFGILLNGVRQMRRGELRSKVESKALVGSMQEFAEELNGLAGVAGVAADKQLKSERMKTELITNVSHDIKTPLTSIINYVDLLERPHTDEEQADYLEVLARQSQRLKKLIDDLMEMSKASTGNMQTEITEVNAGEAITQCLGEFADKLEKANLVPVFHDSDEDIIMMADGKLVWRVMSNLLGNAVKYALPGTRVYVNLTELQDEVLISVKNVSREELNISSEELMERFVRGDVSRNTEGSGLGLNIAKSLMELQHGELELLVDGDLFKVTLIFPKK